MLFFAVVTVTILDDAIPEDDEQFTVQLMNPTGGASLASDSYISVVILANDYVAGIMAFNATSILTNEGVVVTSFLRDYTLCLFYSSHNTNIFKTKSFLVKCLCT
jgi:G-protein coupled receptor 98